MKRVKNRKSKLCCQNTSWHLRLFQHTHQLMCKTIKVQTPPEGKHCSTTWSQGLPTFLYVITWQSWAVNGGAGILRWKAEARQCVTMVIRQNRDAACQQLFWNSALWKCNNAARTQLLQNILIQHESLSIVWCCLRDTKLTVTKKDGNNILRNDRFRLHAWAF